MNLAKFKNTFLVIILALLVSACATQQKTAKIEGQSIFTEYSFLRKLYMSLSQKDQLSYAVTLFVGT